ncbi:MAG: ShlB/FhaC/HecB family hemolysin secretion/activation protein [Rhodocyclaceae bacterium]|nr:ShlB/FhaC/HecB family hemolysin secretion/activation protein [Rhodocyclaceae bacterium]
MHSIRLRYSVAVAALICASVPIQAQEDAGRLEKRFEKPPEPKSSLKPLVFPIDERQPPEKAAEIKFVLKELQLSGHTAFAAADLAPLWADLLNREISLLDIYKLRDVLTARYGNAGFGLSKALVPEQRIQAEGIVRLEIIEGFIDTVIIEGEAETARDYLDHAITLLKAERPANAKTLERYLMLANDRYSIKLTSTLKPSEKNHGATTLILKVEQAPVAESGLTVDDRGTSAVGPAQWNANLAFNGPLGRPGQLTTSYSTVGQSKELQYWTLGYTEVIAHEGTALGLTWSSSESEPGTAALRALNNISESETWTLKLSHPFIRTRQENLTAHLKYEQKDTESRSLGAIASRDNLRSLRTGINYDKADAWEGVNQALVEYSTGIRGLGAMNNDYALKSRADGRVDYQKLTFNLSRKQELNYFSPALAKFSLNAALMGQYAGTGLLSGEECGLGGQQFGRAYDSSEITGDQCLAASVELRYAAPTEGTPFQYAQFYGFYDGGYVRNDTPTSATDPIQKSLSSAGFGVRFGLGPRFTGSIEATQPLTRDVANKGNDNARIFTSLSVRF